MFERFTKDAREVVTGAVAHADGGGSAAGRRAGAPAARAARPGGQSGVLRARRSRARRARGTSVREALGEARRRAGLSQADTDALAGLGIDVEEIVARVEEAHGVGALAGDRKDKRWWSGRTLLRPGGQGGAGAVPAYRPRPAGPAHRRRAPPAGPDGLCPGVPAEVLADHGVTYESAACGCCTASGGRGRKAGVKRQGCSGGGARVVGRLLRGRFMLRRAAVLRCGPPPSTGGGGRRGVGRPSRRGRGPRRGCRRGSGRAGGPGRGPGRR